MRNKSLFLYIILITWCVFSTSAIAGNLDSPAGPGDAGSAMYTIEDVYNRLDTGAEGAKRAGAFVEPTAGPGSTGHTTDDVMTVAPTVDGNGAVAAEVVSGKTFWGLSNGAWGLQTGTAAGTSSCTGDADLISGNIRSTVTIFGVAGDSNVVNTSTGDAGATDIASGKKAWVDGAEVTGTATPPECITCDGTIWNAASGGSRWCDQGDGTVKDMTTGLVWLKDASWGGNKKWRCTDRDADPYDDAQTRAGLLKAGTAGANLSDGSVEGNWRLPTKIEVFRLANGAEAVRSESMHAFTGVRASLYCSCSTKGPSTWGAWGVNMRTGVTPRVVKNFHWYVWPVRSDN